MMKARTRSVAVVVAAVLVAVATLVLATFGAVNHLARRAEQQRRLRLELAAQADQLAAGLVVAVWNIDRAQIDKIIEALEATPAVEAVGVTAAGRVHARVRDAQWRLVPASEPPPAGGALVEEREITFSGEPIGRLRITATPRFIEADLRRSLMSLAGAVVATDILLVLGVYFVLWLLVLRPLLAVERYAVAVSAERSGTAAPIAPAFTAELASLQSSIETMVRLLDQRYAELREQMARRLELQESLRRSENMSAMGALVAGVAHEVRTPLFGMSATLDAYEEELSSADLKDCGAALRQHLSRLTYLMTELLEYGRPPAAQPLPGAVADLAVEVIASRARAAASAQVAIRALIDEDLPDVRMDRARLQQVFENLIDNALQHSTAGQTVSVSARQVQYAGQEWIECSVEDEGRGFAAEDLPRVFEPFFTRRRGGIGLGLSIVQRIVEEHSGRVEASNRPEGGARMTVRLPLASRGVGAQPIAVA